MRRNMCFKKDATIHALVVLSICSNYKARSQICGYPYKGAEVNLNLLGAEDRLCCAEIHQPMSTAPFTNQLRKRYAYSSSIPRPGGNQV
mmetsp:Transcript_8346/g.12496  ORF Transcript_8346/g.12496 Transcript_8346/m.12496 type:complete len:89 (+) Transcript_8346:94-360(+)